MKKLLTICMALLLVASLFAGCAKDKSDWETIKDNGKLVVGITNYAPMDYPDENGEWTGFDAELARMVCKQLSLEVEFLEIDWNSKIMELNAGTIDCAWNGMTLTDEVLSSMECTKPYILNSQVVVMAADAAYTDLSTLTVAVEAGSAGAGVASEMEVGKLNEVETQSAALMEVAAGTSDACIIDRTMADAMTGEGTSYEALGVAAVLTDEEYGIGFRKGSEMAAKVDEILDGYRADGTLQALADKYGLVLADAE